MSIQAAILQESGLDVLDAPGETPGVDVTVTFEGRQAEAANGMQTFLLSVQAYQTLTAEQIAAAVIPTPLRAGGPGSVETQAAQACETAGTRLVEQLRAWREVRSRTGARLFLKVLEPPPGLDMLLQGKLKKACRDVKLEYSKTSELAFRVTCTQETIELTDLIDKAIRAWRPKARFEFVAKDRQMIVIQFNP